MSFLVTGTTGGAEPAITGDPVSDDNLVEGSRQTG
jgi:hypothetical protein